MFQFRSVPLKRDRRRGGSSTRSAGTSATEVFAQSLSDPKEVFTMRRIGLSLTGVAVCLVLAAALGILALPGPTIANPPDAEGNHNHGNDSPIVPCCDLEFCITFRDAVSDAILSDKGGRTATVGRSWPLPEENLPAAFDSA